MRLPFGESGSFEDSLIAAVIFLGLCVGGNAYAACPAALAPVMYPYFSHTGVCGLSTASRLRDLSEIRQAHCRKRPVGYGMSMGRVGESQDVVAQGLPNLSQVQQLDELVCILRRWTTDGNTDVHSQLKSWEAAMAMNHLARLHKRHRKHKRVDKNLLAEANTQLSRLIRPVIAGANTLKPKAFSWALSACAVLPRAAAPALILTTKGFIQVEEVDAFSHTGMEEKETTRGGGFVSRDEATELLVNSMLGELPRFELAQEGVGVQNLAIFAAAVARLEETSSLAPLTQETGKGGKQSLAHVPLLAYLALAEDEASWGSDAHALASFANAASRIAVFRADQNGIPEISQVRDMLCRCAGVAAAGKEGARGRWEKLNGQDVSMLAHALSGMGLLDGAAGAEVVEALCRATVVVEEDTLSAQSLSVIARYLLPASPRASARELAVKVCKVSLKMGPNAWDPQAAAALLDGLSGMLMLVGHF